MCVIVRKTFTETIWCVLQHLSFNVPSDVMVILEMRHSVHWIQETMCAQIVKLYMAHQLFFINGQHRRTVQLDELYHQITTWIWRYFFQNGIFLYQQERFSIGLDKIGKSVSSLLGKLIGKLLSSLWREILGKVYFSSRIFIRYLTE